MRIATLTSLLNLRRLIDGSEAMRISHGVLLAGVLLSGCSVGNEAGFDGDAALARVEEQVVMGPRFPGSEGHAALQEWLAIELGDLGWQTESQSFDYRGTTLTNITAHRGAAPGPLILLGAHYDTRRYADLDPSSPREPTLGANDGASGVAVLLELGRLLGQEEPACDLRLVFFDGEDNGGIDDWEWAVGSRHYAAELARQPLAVVVVDIVGDRDLDLPVEGSSSPDLAAEVWSAAASEGLTAFRDERGPAWLDDHSAFLARGFRAIDIIDPVYPPRHTLDDTLDKVSADSLDQIGEALLAWLEGECLPLEG